MMPINLVPYHLHGSVRNCSVFGGGVP